mgnify:CR=1 FL=1
MWLAQCYILRGDCEKADELIKWANKVKTPTNLLPEQINPFNGSPVSVTPLAWSHAEHLKVYLMKKNMCH